MGSTFTQTSRKPSHKDATRLTRKAGIYYYRRPLPDRLGTDVAISLGTRNFREAEHLAGQLDAVFAREVRAVASTSELRAILRSYLAEGLEDDAVMRLAARPGRPVYTSVVWGHEERSAVDVDEEVVEHCLMEARERLADRDFASLGTTVDRLASEYGVPEEHRKALAHGLLEANVKLLEEIRRRVLGEVPTIFTDEPPAAPVVAAPVAPSGPLLSIAAARYCAYGTREKGWRGQTLSQTKATFSMFQEIAGDRAVGSYTRKDLSGFYDTLRSLPALYAKDRRWRDLPLAKIWGIDAPETKQACSDGWRGGIEAAKYIRELIERREVTCEPRTTDRYGRTVALCRADGVDIGAQMVAAGYAWAFVRYSRDYVALEETAAGQRLGVHAHHCEKAWEYRARLRGGQ